MSDSEFLYHSKGNRTIDVGFLPSENKSSTLNESKKRTQLCSTIHDNDQPPDTNKKRKLALFPTLENTSSCVLDASSTTTILDDDMVLQELSLFINQPQPPSPPLSPTTTSFDNVDDDFVLFP